jgi:hypothetical protein
MNAGLAGSAVACPPAFGSPFGSAYGTSYGSAYGSSYGSYGSYNGFPGYGSSYASVGFTPSPYLGSSLLGSSMYGAFGAGYDNC